MAQANRISGKDVYVTFCGTVLSGDLTSISPSESADTVDVTAGADAFHYYIALRKDGTIGFEAIYETTGTPAVFSSLDPMSAGTLIIGPRGTTSGYEKWTWSRAVVTSRDIELPFDGAVTLKAEFQMSSNNSPSTWGA